MESEKNKQQIHKKYVLVKEYPGSPKLGTEAYSQDNVKMFDGRWIYNIGDNPEFWTEIKEKEYEVLSYYNPVKDSNELFIWDKSNNGLFYYRTHPNYFIKQEEELKTSSLIHSIKRLSDGAIFTIGDKVTSTISKKFGNFNITEIKIMDNSIYIGGEGYHTTLEYLQKVKTNLFITEDKVDIFDKDYYFEIENYNSDNYPEKIVKYKAIEDGEEDYSNPFNTLSLRFSTKEKAEEYIILNKPCLSLKDVLKDTFQNNGSYQSLKKLVKSKLNL